MVSLKIGIPSIPQNGTHINNVNPKSKERSDDEPLGGLVEVFQKATRDITGSVSTLTEYDRWRELGEMLVTELKIAANRTEVSSVPSFLTEHLRRRLWKKDKAQLAAETARPQGREAAEPEAAIDSSTCVDCGSTGFYYPSGFEGGVVKCRHEHLTTSEQP